MSYNTLWILIKLYRYGLFIKLSIMIMHISRNSHLIIKCMIYKCKICKKYENITTFICQITIFHLFDFIIKHKIIFCNKEKNIHCYNFNIGFTGQKNLAASFSLHVKTYLVRNVNVSVFTHWRKCKYPFFSYHSIFTRLKLRFNYSFDNWFFARVMH